MRFRHYDQHNKFTMEQWYNNIIDENEDTITT